MTTEEQIAALQQECAALKATVADLTEQLDYVANRQEEHHERNASRIERLADRVSEEERARQNEDYSLERKIGDVERMADQAYSAANRGRGW